MTGKELLLVLAGTAVAAGGAGVAAALVARGSPDDGADRTALVLERLDELGRSLDATQETLDRNRAAIDGLGDRIADVELRTVGRPGRVDVRPARVPAAEDETAAASGSAAPDSGDRAAGGVRTARLSGGGQGQALQWSDGNMKLMADGAVLELTGALEGLTAGLELRKLPEEERWEKARDELGLTQNQVDEIRAATDERDAALEAAMEVTHSETTGGGRYTVKNLDSTKAKEAHDAYRRRVENSLNDEQRKGWREKGYQRAFGKSGMGAFGGGVGSVISISTQSFKTESSEDASE